ncbi:DUF6477 family protein [Phaeobacter gallaeciensis]|uniref:DUF6477 family protein n=1 Tax=Phaeobacter TaxID=302485 RepID=UPI00237FB686|nr:DUF6477 family protein [Phaeobacter gallaeciensis]MDE4302668.1 DUF6477 family protein [Phaeobacter gallaeciensis]MDE4307238.1 DUF6477 family protein [Phaeobacter gallaeciensis]MDE4311703.1 DUF6477 family protein [Phaeobacter gallaeciensis]MDE4315990.1 DUF6477 family protein [Phaeobacter gallaeciensis]MDE4320630.1 DUF6477 family protein [Phaeobacter gallaeciensis]
MQDALSRLAALHRPRLLVRTARIGASSYLREKSLNRLLGYGARPSPSAAILRLLDMEYELNACRLLRDAGYDLRRHIEVLIALMGEANLLRSSKET